MSLTTSWCFHLTALHYSTGVRLFGRFFFDGFRVGCLVAAGVAAVGALIVLVTLPAQPTPSVGAGLAVLTRADRLST